MFHSAAKLLFSKPISLTVNPKGNPIAPTLSVLIPPGGIESGNPEVCLASGFSPRNKLMTLTVESNNVNLNTSTAALSSKGNSFYFAGYSNKHIETCQMDGIKTKTTDDVPDKVTEVPGSTRAVPTAVICKEETLDNVTDTTYPDYTKVNFTSLVVYGLRVLFAKAVAFNVLFTVKALVF
ncbi:hypothetical protein UPYG_G00289890 [Umbra pygmaea]|uniref:Uncharacterized protein n=1 Tax=Umbra pygmaea TaxID=75934 RepID=A0ABD0WMS5_UMBPY